MSNIVTWLSFADSLLQEESVHEGDYIQRQTAALQYRQRWAYSSHSIHPSHTHTHTTLTPLNLSLPPHTLLLVTPPDQLGRDVSSTCIVLYTFGWVSVSSSTYRGFWTRPVVRVQGLKHAHVSAFYSWNDRYWITLCQSVPTRPWPFTDQSVAMYSVSGLIKGEFPQSLTALFNYSSSLSVGAVRCTLPSRTFDPM